MAGSTGDAPRYIARLGYTTNVARAVDRLEAIRADEQAAMTASADRTWREQQARAWGSCHAAITSALNTFAGEVRVDRRVSSDLRAIERTAQRVDQRVGAQ